MFIKDVGSLQLIASSRRASNTRLAIFMQQLLLSYKAGRINQSMMKILVQANCPQPTEVKCGVVTCIKIDQLT